MTDLQLQKLKHDLRLLPTMSSLNRCAELPSVPIFATSAR